MKFISLKEALLYKDYCPICNSLLLKPKTHCEYDYNYFSVAINIDTEEISYTLYNKENYSGLFPNNKVSFVKKIYCSSCLQYEYNILFYFELYSSKLDSIEIISEIIHRTEDDIVHELAIYYGINGQKDQTCYSVYNSQYSDGEYLIKEIELPYIIDIFDIDKAIQKINTLQTFL